MRACLCSLLVFVIIFLLWSIHQHFLIHFSPYCVLYATERKACPFDVNYLHVAQIYLLLAKVTPNIFSSVLLEIAELQILTKTESSFKFLNTRRRLSEIKVES